MQEVVRAGEPQLVSEKAEGGDKKKRTDAVACWGQPSEQGEAPASDRSERRNEDPEADEREKGAHIARGSSAGVGALIESIFFQASQLTGGADHEQRIILQVTFP